MIYGMIYGKLKLYYGIAIGILVLGLGLCGGTYYYFAIMSIQEIDDEKAKLDADIQKKEAEVMRYEPLTQEIALMQDRLQKMRRRIPQPERIEGASGKFIEFDGFIAKLIELSNNHGVRFSVEVKQISGKRKVQLPPGIKDANYVLKVLGGYNNCLQFLNSLELEDRFVKIESIVIKRPKVAGGESVDPSVLELTIGAVVYTYTKSGSGILTAGQKPAQAKKMSTPPPRDLPR